MLVSMGIEGAPVGGVDYPRTYQEFRGWFPDEVKSRDVVYDVVV
jgi:hypothetical protein